MKVSQNVTNLFLRGGKVVHKEIYGEATTYLIRMSKGDFAEFEEVSFEYVWIQNYNDKYELIIAGYKNGSLTQIRKEVISEHDDMNFVLYRIKVLKKQDEERQVI